MFNLVIVDDEKLTREGLLKHVRWKNLNIHSIYAVSSGFEALVIMEQNRIDILMTDIKMPRMSGVELATHVREKYPDCKIIFLSGYSDKEYLKSAIQLKVENYIDKPMNIAEIENVISQVVNQLKEKISKKENEEILASGLAKSIPLMKQEIALSLINPNFDYEDFKKKYVPLYFPSITESQLYVCCMMPDEKPEKWGQDKSLINQIYFILEHDPNLRALDFYAGQSVDGSVAFIINNSEHILINNSLTILQEHLFQKLQLTFTIGISTQIYSILSIPSGYSEAYTAVSERFYLGGNQIIHYSGRRTGPILDPSIFQMDKFSLESVRGLFDHLIQRQYKDIESLKQNIYKLYCIMMQRTINPNTMSYSDFAAMTLIQMKEFILFGMHALRTLGDDEYEPIVKETVHFILWNYIDSNLDIKKIADAVNLSPNYLCSIFKQNTQSTINDFIIQIRLEKAKKLLSTSKLRLYEISSKVGIPDPNYFSALFKQKCGMTPSEYRSSRKGDENV